MFDFREWVILIGYVQNNRTYAETTHIVGAQSFAPLRAPTNGVLDQDLRKS
jgi:hypothetical protein